MKTPDDSEVGEARTMILRWRCQIIGINCDWARSTLRHEERRQLIVKLLPSSSNASLVALNIREHFIFIISRSDVKNARAICPPRTQCQCFGSLPSVSRLIRSQSLAIECSRATACQDPATSSFSREYPSRRRRITR